MQCGYLWEVLPHRVLESRPRLHHSAAEDPCSHQGGEGRRAIPRPKQGLAGQQGRRRPHRE